MNDTQTLALESASVAFPVRTSFFGRSKQFVHALSNVSIALHDNETVALVGESGSGKSTLALAMLGLRRLTDGQVFWRHHRVAELSPRERLAFRRDVQVVFQDPYASLNPRQSILDSIRRPLEIHRIVPSSEIDSVVEHLLDEVGLRPARLFAERYPHELSGGQRQRVAIVRSLVLKPHVLVADEPVSALDVSVRTQILNLLARLKRDLRLSMLFLSHDLGVVRFIADRVAVMYLGKLVEIAPTDELFRHPHHPYTRVLLSAAPSAYRGSGVTPLSAIGEPPRPTDPPSGCRFHTRCPLAFARCSAEEPPLRSVTSGHLSACHLDGEAFRGDGNGHAKAKKGRE